MKTLSIYAVLLFSIFSGFTSFAQKNPLNTNEKIKVWGNCETCKKRIEKAAKKGGAITAAWDEESKELAISYDGAKTSSTKIQQAIADAGHDTQDLSASDATYNKLPGCCQYDRKPKKDGAAVDVKKCGDHAKCAKDGHTCKDMADCKGMTCCKGKAACSKDKACTHGKTAAKGMACCKM